MVGFGRSGPVARAASWLTLGVAITALAPPSTLADGGPLCDLNAPFGAESLLCGLVCPPPAPPTGLTLAENATGFLLSWDPPLPQLQPVLGYDVYRADLSDGETPQLIAATWSDTSYFDGDVTAGHQYAYTVASVDGCGSGPPGPPVIDTFQGPCSVVRPDDPLNGGIYFHPECIGP